MKIPHSADEVNVSIVTLKLKISLPVSLLS